MKSTPTKERTDSIVRQFEALYDEYYDKVFVYIARRSRQISDAEDLTAEVFKKVFANPYDPRLAKFSAYIFTIARNTLKNHWRDTAKHGAEAADETDFILPGDTILDGMLTREEYAELKQQLLGSAELS